MGKLIVGKHVVKLAHTFSDGFFGGKHNSTRHVNLGWTAKALLLDVSLLRQCAS